MKQNTGAQNVRFIPVPQKYYIADEKIITQHNNRKNDYLAKVKSTLKMTIGAVATFFATTGLLLLASSFSIGYTVKVDDTVVGTVATKNEYYEVLDEVKSETSEFQDASFEPDGEESFHVELVKKDAFTQKDELAENIRSISGEAAQAASAAYDDGSYQTPIAETTPDPVGTGEFAMPTSGTLSSPFGTRWGRKHTGIDLRASIGTPIYASDNGIVLKAEYNKNGYGNLIIIDHGNGFVTYYAHCEDISATAGDVVKKGDFIGTVGNTGRSTGPHLHFEIREDGTAKDPMPYLKK